MSKLPRKVTKIVVGVVVLAVLVGAGIYFFAGGTSPKTVTARFTSAVGVYTGTPVDILGVEVGKVTSVTPHGSYVSVGMEYSGSQQLPAKAVSVIIANSIVSDRYVQLAPAYSGSGPTLADGATIGTSRTAAPAELDDIYAALNKLSVALGPKGANKHGALSKFLQVSQANLKGNGAALGTSITKLSAAAKTLANGRKDLFGTVKNLQAFTQALAQSDQQVKHFDEQLAQVSGDLASERKDLGAALHNLGIALNAVATFVDQNAGKAHTDIVRLEDITRILVKEQSSLNETFSVAPVALANIVHAYNPDLGVLGTRSNLASVTDPANLCQVLRVGGLLSPVQKLLGPLTGKIANVCTKLLKNLPDGSKFTLPAGLDPSQLKGLLDKLLGGGGGGLGGIITGGS